MPDFAASLKRLEEKYSVHIEYLAETTSTNDVAAGSRFRGGDIVLAEFQTKGRGQRGHSWSSHAGENLLFTAVLEPGSLSAEKQFRISKTVSSALVGTFAAFGIEARIKWTNDIYVGDRKIVGILIENDVMGEHIKKSIIGIGINVNQTDFDPAVANPVSMAVLKGRKFDRAEVLDVFMGEMHRQTKMLEEGGFGEVDAEYASNLYRKGEMHTFAYPDGNRFRAAIEGVEEGGELILKHEDGKVLSYLFREVEFVI